LDDDENVIDLTGGGDEEDDNHLPYHTTLSFNHFFPQINEDYEINEMRNDGFDIKILDLRSLNQLHSKVFDNNELDIRILNDVDKTNDLNRFVEVLEDEDDIYKDMPPLEPVEDLHRIEDYLDDIHNKQTSGVVKDHDTNNIPIFNSTMADVDETQLLFTPCMEEDDAKEPNEITLLDETSVVTSNEVADETMSEDGSIYKKHEKHDKNEKMGGYRKLNVQTLRELAVSKGLVQDASKLKKGELLNLLIM